MTKKIEWFYYIAMTCEYDSKQGSRESREDQIGLVGGICGATSLAAIFTGPIASILTNVPISEISLVANQIVSLPTREIGLVGAGLTLIGTTGALILNDSKALLRGARRFGLYKDPNVEDDRRLGKQME